MWSFIPKSKSVRTMIGVCKRSAKSKASVVSSKQSFGLLGNNKTCLVSPCEAYAEIVISDCCVRVGIPVDGPVRCTSIKTAGISAKYPKPKNSFINETPGPEVAVKDLAPFQFAPITIPMAASSSSACTIA